MAVKTDSGGRPAYVGVRLKTDEWDRLELAARQQGTTVSKVMRSLIGNIVVVERPVNDAA